MLLSQEDHFIKTLNPEYNILQNAGNSLGYKHTPESIDKTPPELLLCLRKA